MIITVDSRAYGPINVEMDEAIYFEKGLDKKKIGVEYNKSKKWYYAYICVGKRKIRLHRFIMNCPEGMVVDHINGDTLDNRMSNLRVVTQKENLQNRMDTLRFNPTVRNKFGIRGLMKLYDKGDKRFFYRVKLKGYKIKTFALSRYDEAVEYARHPEKI